MRCEERLYDQHFVVDGPVGRLRHDYIDILTDSLTSWTDRHNRWATLEAAELLATQSNMQVQPAGPVVQSSASASSGPRFTNPSPSSLAPSSSTTSTAAASSTANPA